MAKRVRVSSDNQVTWYTLPGSSGEKRTNMAAVDDTVFGQNWQSQSPSIGDWSVTGSSFFKGIAGYTANIRSGGTPVQVTGGATTLVTGKTYQINNTAQRFMSYANAIVVKVSAVDQTAQVLSIDYLNGTVTFKAAYSPGAAPTIDYYYVPLTTLGKARSFKLQQQAAEIDTTDYATAAANGGWRTYQQGLRNVSLELSNVWNSSNDFLTSLAARNLLYIDISPNNVEGTTAETMFRGFFKYLGLDASGNVGALEEETLKMGLYVPDGSLVQQPFAWYFGSASVMNQAVQIAVNAWQNGTVIDVEYSPDGTVGVRGDCIVTEASLNNSFDGQNEFSFTFRGVGVQTAF